MANASRIQLRNDTASNFSVGVTPYLGEPVFETDTKTLRVGDGSTSAANLPVLPTGSYYQVLQTQRTIPQATNPSSIFPNAFTLDANSTYEVEVNAFLTLTTAAALATGDGVLSYGGKFTVTTTGSTGNVASRTLTITSSPGIVIGMVVSGSGISGSPTVTAVDPGNSVVVLSSFVTVSAGTNLTFTVAASTNLSLNIEASQTVSPNTINTTTATTTATTSTGGAITTATNITLTPVTNVPINVSIGQTVAVTSGTGMLPTGTKVTSVVGNVIQVSAPSSTNFSGTVTLTFSNAVAPTVLTGISGTSYVGSVVAIPGFYSSASGTYYYALKIRGIISTVTSLSNFYFGLLFTPTNGGSSPITNSGGTGIAANVGSFIKFTKLGSNTLTTLGGNWATVV